MMIIEIHAPGLKVPESTITSIKKKVSGLSRLGEKISLAEVYLSEEAGQIPESMTCKIRLTLIGDSLFASKHASSFDKAARSVISILKRRLKRMVEKATMPPEEIVTTVNVGGEEEAE